MRKFEFKKSYEEIEIGGEVFRIDFNDEKTNQYVKKLNEFQKEISELQNVDESKLSDDQKLKHFDDIKGIVKKVIEEFLGEGNFGKLYESAGHSIMNVMDLVFYISEVVSERLQKDREEKRNYYVKKK
ncbi:hypothetical protein ACFFIX_06645 [Metabacillus herbersteinensis]|uniref:Uncharacterized protein n=1 Tax=Metabacillus herbersteinensis TaxID=283816 RepID=A0ABV6GBS4_9BACI